MADRSKIGRTNKSRAKVYENDAAKILGGKRFLADTGGPVDVDHDWLSIQVKSKKRIVSQDPVVEGLAAAQAGAVGRNKLPCVVLYNRIEGKPLQKFIMFDLAQFADWHGLGGECAD